MAYSIYFNVVQQYTAQVLHNIVDKSDKYIIQQRATTVCCGTPEEQKIYY